MKRPLTKFNLVLAALSIILIILGALLMGRTESGYYFLYPGLLLAAIFSITSVVDVFQAKEISEGRRIIWVILSISVPVLGGLLFYFIHMGKSRTVPPAP